MAHGPRSIIGIVLGLAVAVSRAEPTTFLPENDVPWDYVVPPLQGHCLQDYRLYLPPDTVAMPSEGWPVVIGFDLSVFEFTSDHPQLPTPSCLPSPTCDCDDPGERCVLPMVLFDEFYMETLRQGIAVVAARATPSASLDNRIWDECGDGFALPGHGLFHPPGAVADDVGIAPYDEAAYHMAEKDAVMVIQHVRHLAAQEPPYADEQAEAMARLDHRRIAVNGASAGAVALMWAAYGPDRRHELPFVGLGGQYDLPTRPDLAVLGTAPVWWPVYDASWFSVGSMHWGAGGDSEIPAVLLQDVATDDLLGSSAVFYEDCSLNGELSTYVYEIDPSPLTAYDRFEGPICGGLPFCFGVEGQVDDTLHPQWNGYVLKTLYPDVTELSLAPVAVPDPNGPDAAFFPDTSALALDAVRWLVERFSEEPDPWTRIEQVRLPGEALCTQVSLPWSGGSPDVTAMGSLMAGQASTITLSGAEPGAIATLYLSESAIDYPVLGGVLVPDVTRIWDQFTGAVEPNGTLSYVSVYPDGLPAGYTFYGQWVIVGQEIAASHAIRGVAP